jgi:hypothetical protein
MEGRSNMKKIEDAYRERVIDTFDKNCELYPDKSTAFLLAITADELEAEIEDVVEIVINPGQ